MSGELLGIFQSLKAIGTLAKSITDAKIASEITSAILNIQSDLMAAQAVALDSQKEQTALTKRVAELEAEIVEFKNWEAEAAEYTLKEVSAGRFAYIYCPAVHTTKPRHWACANCYQSRKISILQGTRQAPKAGWPGYVCNVCGSEVVTGGSLPPIDSAYSP